MPQPRHTQIDVNATRFYHCISRCVRRSFLCGTDRVTGHSFNHRKAWIVELLSELTSIFAIDLCAFAILSNHYHLVVRVDGERARAWTPKEVVVRYGRLFAPTVEARLAGPKIQVGEWVSCWRARLYDLSWFMRCLNEAIARRANAEDDCTGRFWEGRFRSQALLDDAGLLTCMAYVDLNPVRAGLAEGLEDSDFTSIQQRLAQVAPATRPEARYIETKEVPPASRQPTRIGREISGTNGTDVSQGAPILPVLWPFEDAPQAGNDPIPMTLPAYAELLAVTATCLRGEPSTTLPDNECKQLEGLGIVGDSWLESLRNYTRHFFTMVGRVYSIDVYCARTDRDHAKGRRWAAVAFRAAS